MEDAAQGYEPLVGCEGGQLKGVRRAKDAMGEGKPLGGRFVGK